VLGARCVIEPSAAAVAAVSPAKGVYGRSVKVEK
jgi:hypothetical protein